MTRNDNKGFSLIDVVIAVALLSLLLGPILLQISRTLKVSAESKERQYVLDNAEYVMNYFQSVNSSEIATKTDAISMKDNNVYINYSAVDTFNCELFDESGDSRGITLTYNVRMYQLDDAKLGRADNEYGRQVVLDNLSNKIMAASTPESSTGYQIDYTIGEADRSNLESKGFVYMNDGSYVKYADKTVNGNTFHLVSGVIVKTKSTAYVDPNEMPIGSIQNLDKDTVAIIQGSASDFDKAAESDFFAAMMANYKKVCSDNNNLTPYYNALENPNFTFDNMVGTARPEKYTIVSVTKSPTVDTNGLGYYIVKCNVYYTYTYNLESTSFTSSLGYSVYSRKFYTTTAPDVYMIYEPFVVNSDYSTSSFRYAPRDYIITYNDSKTDGSNEALYGPASRLYLYKPNDDQLQVDYQKAGISVPGKNQMKDDRVYYTQIGDATYKPVEIHVIHASQGTTDCMPVITNMTVDETANQTFKSIVPRRAGTGYISKLSGSELKSAGSVFYNTTSSKDPAKAALDSAGLIYTDCKDYPGDPRDGVYNEGSDMIYMIPDDTVESVRLYSITITFTEKEDTSNVIRYTGSKGADN